MQCSVTTCNGSHELLKLLDKQHGCSPWALQTAQSLREEGGFRGNCDDFRFASRSFSPLIPQRRGRLRLQGEGGRGGEAPYPQYLNPTASVLRGLS